MFEFGRDLKRLFGVDADSKGAWREGLTGGDTSLLELLDLRLLTNEARSADVIAGHRDMIRRARAAGLRTVGATLGPMRGSAFSTPRSEAARAEVNAWIRGSGEYDAVLDIAAVLGDALDPAHDSGDHLHPGDAGYRAMAEAKGRLLVFTDDDVDVEPEWLANLAGAAERHPEVTIFGGKVMPRWERTPPRWILETRLKMLDFVFVRYDLGDAERPLSDADILAKFHDLADGPLGATAANGLLDAVASLSSQQDVTTLTERLLSAPKRGSGKDSSAAA